MTLNELSNELKKMYQYALKGEQVTMIYLFGIKYSDQVKEYAISDIITQSGLHTSYKTELAKAVKLAKYVKEKN